MVETYLVRPFAVDGHNEANAACLVLVLGIVESLFTRCLPWHLLLLLLLFSNILDMFNIGLNLVQIGHIRLFVITKVIDIDAVIVNVFKVIVACCTFKFAIVSDYWCHYTQLPVHLLKLFALLFNKIIIVVFVYQFYFITLLVLLLSC